MSGRRHPQRHRARRRVVLSPAAIPADVEALDIRVAAPGGDRAEPDEPQPQFGLQRGRPATVTWAFSLMIVIALLVGGIALPVMTGHEIVHGCKGTAACTPAQSLDIGQLLMVLAVLEALLAVGVLFGRRLARRITLVFSAIFVALLLASAGKDAGGLVGVPIFAAPGVLTYWEQLQGRPAPTRRTRRPLFPGISAGPLTPAVNAVRWLMGRSH